MIKNRLIGIIGATALGKTKLAVRLAVEIDGEIISADSRQVYKGMDIGTGKDLDEYLAEGKNIPYHLINIKDAGEEYNVFQFQMDFYAAYQQILERGKYPILCGGTGMYLEAALSPTKMLEVPHNSILRESLENLDDGELGKKLRALNPKLHNSTDLLVRSRLLRALEIEEFRKKNKGMELKSPLKDFLLFGLKTTRPTLHERIARRLDDRLKNGLIEEVDNLIKNGLDHKMLNFYGLEYRFVSEHLQGVFGKNDMRNHLLKAIKQFAKKQETWFRRMEKRGAQINWLDADASVESNLDSILKKIGE